MICVYIHTCIYKLLKALPQVYMKYAAQGESQVANKAKGKAKCYICHETLTKSCILLFKQHGSVLSVLLLSEPGIWLGKILANGVSFAKFAKVFPAKFLCYRVYNHVI